MKRLKIPAAQDVVRLIGPDDAETERRLHGFLTDPSGGFFSYRPAHTLCRYAFGHALPLGRILDGCHRVRNKQGRTSNSEVLRLLWNLSEKRSVTTHELKPKKLDLRKDLSIKVAPPFYFVENGKAYVFWLQPRKGHAHSLAELGLLASIVKVTYLVDDWEDVGFEVCDLSAPILGGKRDPRTYHLESFSLHSETEVHEALQRFARAYLSLKAKGIETKKRSTKRPDVGPGLFDDQG